MLYVKVRDMEMYDGNIDARFRNNAEDEWFDDPFVHKIIETIDHNKIIARGVFESPVLGIMGPDRLSGGAKALILAYKMPELEQWIGLFGDNCIKPLIELSQQCDLTIAFSYLAPELPEVFDATFLKTNRVTHTKNEFIDEYVDLMQEVANKRTRLWEE